MKIVFFEERRSKDKKMDPPYVSVIVPAYNEEAHISNCIRSLLDQSYPEDEYEVIIVDNGSTDKTPEIVNGFPVKLLFEDVKSSYAARNRGILNSCGYIITFTDADCMADRDWIKNSVEILNGEADFIAGKIELLSNEKPSLIETYGLSRFMTQDVFAGDGWAATANMVTKRELFEEVGLFDQRLVSGGDLEWGRRASGMGYKIVYGEYIVVKHPTRKSFKDLFSSVFRYGVGMGQIYKIRQGNINNDPVKKFNYIFRMMFENIGYGCIKEIERLKEYRNRNSSNIMFLQFLILTLLLGIGSIYGIIYGYTKSINSVQQYFR